MAEILGFLGIVGNVIIQIMAPRLHWRHVQVDWKKKHFRIFIGTYNRVRLILEFQFDIQSMVQLWTLFKEVVGKKLPELTRNAHNIKLLLTLARTDLLNVKNWGTQWTIVSYLKKWIKIKTWKRQKDPRGHLGSTR